MGFGTFTDTEGMWIDTVHFPPQAKAFPFSGPGCYRLIGKVTEEFDFTSIEIQMMYRMTTLNREDASPEEIALSKTAIPKIHPFSAKTTRSYTSASFNVHVIEAMVTTASSPT